MKDHKTGISSSQVEQKLHTAYRSLASKKKSTVLFRSIMIIAAGFITLVLAEHLFYLNSSVKTIVSFLLLILSALSVWRGMKSINNQSFKEFYRTFSRKSQLPELKDTLDLQKTGKGNQALIDAAILQNLSRIEPSKLDDALVSFNRESSINTRFRTSLLFSSLTVVVAAFTLFNFNDASKRSVTFWENYNKPNPFTFTVAPGNTTLEQGSAFEASAIFSENQIPENVSLQIKTSVEQNFRTIGMNKIDQQFQSIPFELNDDMEYFIQMDGFISDIYTADVQLRPRFSTLSATVIPPDYTQLDSTNLEYPFSQIRAYEGSDIIISGELNKHVASLELHQIDTTEHLQVHSDSTIHHQLELTKPDTLTFSITDENGLKNKNPFQVTISPQTDEYPVVDIIEPEQYIEKVNPKNLDIIYRAADDFQLSGASFHYELKRAFVDEPISGSLSLSTPSNGATNSFQWGLDSLNLKPQDVLSFWVQVQDNDGYRGYKTAQSQILTLTVPSMVDYFDNLDEKETDVKKDLDEVSESFEQMQQQYDRFKEKMKENPDNIGYEQSQELEQVKRQQEEVQKQIDELNKRFEEIKQEINESNVLSEETQRAYDELQKLMKEIDDPAFLEALEKMHEQLGQMNPEELREAMENLEFNEELYKERLERTLELFKQLKLNSDLDKLTKSYEDMARKEQELQERDLTGEEKSQQREQSIKENEELKEQVESLSENATKKSERALSEYQKKAKDQLEELSKQLQEEMKKQDESENEDSGSKSDNNNQDQQNFQQQYQQLAEMTKNLMEGMNQQQAQINIAGLKYILHSLLALSVEQEDLTTLAAATETRSQAFITFARDQRNVEDIFSAISDSLYQLSTESPQFSNEINKKKLEVEKQLQRALEQMAERNQSRSSVATRQAMGGINDISFMVANLLEQLQNSQNGGGGGGGGMSVEQMMEQLQQSGEQQQQLNQQLQNIINDIQGERLSQDQMKRLDDIAKAQNRIRKQLQEIQQNGQGGDEIGSELERMIEEMENTINDLRGGAADPTMIERQQNILSRMLEAEEALQERDEEEKREGRTPTEFDRATPPELTLEELEKQIKNRLNDPDFTKYSEDYQRLIEKYFELLQEIQ